MRCYAPVVVRAELRGPYVDNGDPIHLDGLLARAWVRRHANRVHGVGLPTRQTPLSDLQRPHLEGALARLQGPDGHAVWMASAALAVEPTHFATVWTIKRRDSEDWDRLARPVMVTAGPAKDYMLRRAARVSSALVWLAWGKRQQIKRDLRLIWGREDQPHGAVGSVRRTGSGEIARWSIVDGDHSPADVLVHQGVVRRQVPRSWLTAVQVPSVGACEPPYWHPGRQQDTVRVGTEAQLHAGVLAQLERLCS